MTNQAPLNLVMPGNFRYQPRSLKPIFGYDYQYLPLGRVEVANLQVLGEIEVIPPEDMALLTGSVIQSLLEIRTTRVDEVEKEITSHDVRAWILLGQEKLPPRLRRWVHLLFTSYDPLDTARILMFLEAHEQVIKPLTCQVVEVLARKIRQNADVLQIGRTHGQHALPITVGFWLATILSRMLHNAEQMDIFVAGLRGKISGAVGAYNAQVGLGVLERCGDRTFEERVLEKVGLQPARISTQILPPEPLSYYLFSCLMLSAAFGQLGRDCRHLMRTEISEIREDFETTQVGSSTMAHKRNPINFENMEGTFIRTKCEFGKVLEVLISDHQRDLVGSSVMRDFPIIVVNLVQQMTTFLRSGKTDKRPFFDRVTIDPEACQRNFGMQSGVILAEPIYIALQMGGYEGDAHDVVNHRAMPIAQNKGVSLMSAVRELAAEDHDIGRALSAIPQEVRVLLEQPESYTGLSSRKALEIVGEAERFLANQQS